MRYWGAFVLSFFISVTSFAFQVVDVEVTAPVTVGVFNLGIGSSVEITMANGLKVPGLFLGALQTPSGKQDQYMFVDIKRTHVYLVPKKVLSLSMSGKAQPILNPYAQVGGTCASYAMFDYFLQLNLSKTVKAGSAELMSKDLGTEEGRTQLLAKAIDYYYIERPHTIDGAARKIAKEYGMNCKLKQFQTHTDAIAFLRQNLDQGIPVMIAFNLTSEMVNSSYEVQKYESLDPEDPRLWIPRQVGQRKNGGHTIVLAASFYNGKRFKAVVVDSDWDEPRIWDVAGYINARTYMKDMEFVTCK